MTTDPVRLAEVELLGALTYGQLRGYSASVAVVAHAPDVRRADKVLAFTGRERARYDALRARLDELTELPGPVLDRQKRVFDGFFDALPLGDWLGGIVFLAVGLPLAADFARAVAPTVDDRTAEVIVEALTGRTRMEAFVSEELRSLLDGGDVVAARARRLTADVIGLALTQFTAALGETDALRVLFEHLAQEQGITAEVVVKRMAMQVLEGHRRRMHALGLDDLVD